MFKPPKFGNAEVSLPGSVDPIDEMWYLFIEVIINLFKSILKLGVM